MKKLMNIREFKEYYVTHKPEKIIYNTENQPWNSTSDCCRIKAVFPKMLILENPNEIYLESSENTFCFDRARRIEVDTETSVLGTIFTLFCGSFNKEEYEMTYKLVAQYCH